MKGMIVDCLMHLVSDNYGAAKWTEISNMSGVDPAAASAAYRAADDVDDALVSKMFSNTCQATGLSFEQACDAYGQYWVGAYIPSRYPEFYAGVGSTREFLQKLDGVHASMAGRLEGAEPPRHGYEWKNERTLIMSYRSRRDLIEMFVGAVRGAAKHFGDAVEVRQIDRGQVEIDFLS